VAQEFERDQQGGVHDIPQHLIVVAIYWGFGVPMGSDPDEFLDERGRGQPDGVGMWYVGLSTRMLNGDEAAKAAFSVHHGQALCEALWVNPDHRGLGIGQYLVRLGQGLCGTATMIGVDACTQIDETGWHSPYPGIADPDD
jgi:GNAT superfamily N-acetyltransferase